MPSTYTHYSFGIDLLNMLPEKYKTLAESNLDYYLLGQHGPDIMFFYKPSSKKHEDRVGHNIHYAPASQFFMSAIKKLKANNCDDKDKAYLMGFVCHFALDRQCHTIVEAIMKATKYSHSQIESAFDGYYLNKNSLGFNTCTAKHIKTHSALINTAAKYFDVGFKELKGALSMLHFFHSITPNYNIVWSNILYGIFSVSKKTEFMRGIVIGKVDHKGLAPYMPILAENYQRALKNALKLIDDFFYACNNNCDLSLEYNVNFEADPSLIDTVELPLP